MTAADELGRYFATVGPDAFPAGKLHDMRRLLLDYFGVALSGSQSESGRAAARVMTGLGGAPQSTVIGYGVRVSAPDAAFANAVSEHSIELDDIDVVALFHYGPPIVSAALAVAEWRGATGAELLAAMLCGCETMNRVSLACNPALRNRGFHTTPTAGVFGAAVAAGRLLGLSGDQLVSALGLAGAQASGLMEMYGPSMQKRVNPGPAARNGITAALLAREGFTGADTIFEGERGFGNAFAGGIDLSKMLDGLTDTITTDVEYKPYSAARPIHNSIDAALALREAGVTADTVKSLVIARHPDWAHYHLNRRPATFHEAQVSLPYSTAIALIDGGALPPQYAGSQLSRPGVLALIDTMTVETDPALPRGVSCRLTATLADGSTVIRQVDDPRGSLANPLSDKDLEGKFTMLASPVLSAGGAERLATAIWSTDALDDVGELLSLAAPAEVPGHAA
ncbi:MAG TPA: MmgE/PrpD family protein [Trebonia sp.]